MESIEAPTEVSELMDKNIITNLREYYWNGRLVSFNINQYNNITTLSASIDDHTNSSECSEKEKTNETAQEHFDNAQHHLAEFGLTSVFAGISATHGPIGVIVAAGEIALAAPHLIEACKEYNEGKRIEAEANSRDKDDYDSSHDRDSWDRDY